MNVAALVETTFVQIKAAKAVFDILTIAGSMKEGKAVSGTKQYGRAKLVRSRVRQRAMNTIKGYFREAEEPPYLLYPARLPLLLPL